MKRIYLYGSLVICCLAIFIIFFLYFIHLRKDDVECTAHVVFKHNDTIFQGNMRITTSHTVGHVFLDGTLASDGNIKAIINRVVNFSYTRHEEEYIFKSNEIVKSPKDTFGQKEESYEETIPYFYIKTGSFRHYRIVPYKEAYLISTSQMPTIYCKLDN